MEWRMISCLEHQGFAKTVELLQGSLTLHSVSNVRMCCRCC